MCVYYKFFAKEMFWMIIMFNWGKSTAHAIHYFVSPIFEILDSPLFVGQKKMGSRWAPSLILLRIVVWLGRSGPRPLGNMAHTRKRFCDEILQLFFLMKICNFLSLVKKKKKKKTSPSLTYQAAWNETLARNLVTSQLQFIHDKHKHKLERRKSEITHALLSSTQKPQNKDESLQMTEINKILMPLIDEILLPNYGTWILPLLHIWTALQFGTTLVEGLFESRSGH